MLIKTITVNYGKNIITISRYMKVFPAKTIQETYYFNESSLLLYQQTKDCYLLHKILMEADQNNLRNKFTFDKAKYNWKVKNKNITPYFSFQI